MLLSEVVRYAGSDEQIESAIRPNLKQRFEQAHMANQETSPAEYLYIDELTTLFGRTPDTSYPTPGMSLLWFC